MEFVLQLGDAIDGSARLTSSSSAAERPRLRHPELCHSTPFPQCAVIHTLCISDLSQLTSLRTSAPRCASLRLATQDIVLEKEACLCQKWHWCIGNHELYNFSTTDWVKRLFLPEHQDRSYYDFSPREVRRHHPSAVLFKRA
eukprot:6828718-Pyramimonas_sp.AAC.1